MNNFTKSKLTRLLRLLDKGKLKHAYFGEDAKGKAKKLTVVTFVIEEEKADV